MPCTMSDDEIAFFNRENNKKLFGVDASTESMLARFLCELLTQLEIGGAKPSPECERWWLVHKATDLVAGRKHE